jgi:parallel beta-helix repeat protein
MPAGVTAHKQEGNKSMKDKLKAGGAMLLLASLGVTIAIAQTPITTAGEYILVGGDYLVTVDTLHSEADTSHGIYVRPDNVYIDGNGKLALGAGQTLDRQGIYVRAVSGPAYNVNVENLTFKDYRHGAYYRAATGSVINCTFIACQKGINANSRADASISGVVIKGNTLENSHKMAIEVRGPRTMVIDNLITANMELTSNGRGIGIERSHPIGLDGGHNTTNCLISGNTIQGGGFMQEGLWLDRSIDNTYVDNVIEGCAVHGILLSGNEDYPASGNTFTNTAITLADSAIGINLDRAPYNIFDSTTVTGPNWALVAADSSVGNLFSNSSLSDSILITGGSEVTLINTVFDTSMAVVDTLSTLRWGFHVTVDTEFESAPVTTTILIEDTNGVDLAVGESGDEIDLVTWTRTADATTYVGPVVITAALNTAMMDYEAIDTVEVTADMTVTLDTWEQDLSQAYYVIRSAGTYTFPDTMDLSTAPVNAIKVFADNVTIDGGDSTVLIGGGATIDRQGVWPRSTSPDHNEDDPARLNVNVLNLTAIGFRTGAYYRLASGILNGCTFIECGKGVNINNRRSPLITGVNVSENTIHNSSNYAIEFRAGPNGRIINNVITADSVYTGNMRGIAIERSHPIADGGYNTTNCQITGNTISDMKEGIRADRSIGNLYKNNTITNCLAHGVLLMGLDPIRAIDNTFENTTIECTAGDSIIGVEIIDADENVFDNLTVNAAGVAVKANGESKNNVIMNSEITNSVTYDFELADNTNLFVVNTTYDQAKVSVEEGSALFIGEGFDVDLSVWLLDYAPVAGADVVVTNAAGDEVNSYVTNDTGATFLRVAAEGITAGGHSASQNPFTITATAPLDGEGVIYQGVITVTVTSDTSFDLSLTAPFGIAEDSGLPTEFALAQNYPNPFNPVTTIQYAMPVNAIASLRIYNMLGQMVKTLVSNENLVAGYHQVIWDGKDEYGKRVSSGIYIYELATSEFRDAKKMVFLK